MEQITDQEFPDKVTGDKLTAAEVMVVKNKLKGLITASNSLETKTTGIFKTTNGAEVSIDMSTYSPGYVLAAHPSQSNTLIFIEAGTEPENQTPTVNAGEDLEITLPTDTVQLLGTASDPDGTIESYLWSQVSGSAATIATPSNQNTIVSGLTEGSYVFRLTVTDDDGGTSFDDVNILVNQEIFNTHSLVTTSKQQGVNFTDNSIYPSEGGGVDTPFTKEIWFKPIQVGRVGVISRAVDSNTSSVLLQILQQANGTIRCDISSSTGNRISMITSASTIVEVNKFYCLVVSYSGTKLNSGIKMYLNGVLPSLVNGNSGTYIGLPPLQGDFKIQVPITDNTDTIWFDGKVSLIRSYSIALDATQASELYNGNEPRSLSGLDFADSCVLEYRFNNNLISNTGVNPEPVGELVFDTDTPWSVPNHKMDFSEFTQLESVFWPRIYKSSDWPQWETTKDYFTIYSTDHGAAGGGIAWAECDDPFYNGFVERGIIRSGNQSETPWMLQVGENTHLYYHIFTGEGTPNQRTGLMIATGGVLHTATWTEQTPPLGYVEGENHLGYARVISNAGGYVAHHVTHGNPSVRHAISHSTDGKTFIRGIETTNRTVGGYVYTSISPFVYNGTQYAFVIIVIDGGQKIAICTLDADTLPLAIVDIIPEFYTVTILHSYVEGDIAYINIKWSYIGFRNKPHYVLTYDLTQLN